MGFDAEDDRLVYVRQIALNSYRRMVIDLPARELLLEDQVPSVPMNGENNAYLPFGPLKREIPCSRWNQYSGIDRNQRGEQLSCYSFYPQFVYYQPPGEDCLDPNRNQGCVRVNKLHPYEKYGFSATGNYFAVAERYCLTIWNIIN